MKREMKPIREADDIRIHELYGENGRLLLRAEYRPPLDTIPSAISEYLLSKRNELFSFLDNKVYSAWKEDDGKGVMRITFSHAVTFQNEQLIAVLSETHFSLKGRKIAVRRYGMLFQSENRTRLTLGDCLSRSLLRKITRQYGKVESFILCGDRLLLSFAAGRRLSVLPKDYKPNLRRLMDLKY